MRDRTKELGNVSYLMKQRYNLTHIEEFSSLASDIKLVSESSKLAKHVCDKYLHFILH